jgi:hypothetical protein
MGTLQANGFKSVIASRREGPYFDLWALASKSELSEIALKELAKEHFPG